MKSTIRPARMLDLDAVYEFAIQQRTRYPKLRFDANRAYETLKIILGSGRHYSMLSEVEGRVAGLLLAASAEHMWAEGTSCQIVFWVSRVPGDGHALLRRFKQWVLGRRSTISVAGFSPDLVMDWRTLELVKRVGFKKCGGSYLHHN